MTAAAVTAPRAWQHLNAAERRAGAEALNYAIDELVRAGGNRSALAIAAGANTDRLVLGADGWRLLIEVPRYTDRGRMPTHRALALLDPDEEWAAASSEAMPLVAGLRVLTDPQGGPAELERRRAELEQRRRREGQRRAERTRLEQAALSEAQRWQDENASALRIWNALPRVSQALHRAAQDHPADVGAALRQVADLLAQDRVAIEAPASFLEVNRP